MMPVKPAWTRSPALPRGFSFERAAHFLPLGLVKGEAGAAAVIAGHGWPLAGGPIAFTLVGVAWAEAGTTWLAVAPFAEAIAWAESEGEDLARQLGQWVRRTGAPRAPWAGLALDRPRIMGIVNVTPDSFSDGGDHADPGVAVAAGLAMVEAGADIIDIGGESTRPGAAPVSPDQERDRVLPVVRALAEKGVTVSIDTRHASVMAAALASGAAIVNDVTALEGEGALAVVARSGAAVCLMHMQGQPQTMQAEPRYRCAPLDICDYLAARVAACEAAGIDRARVAVDPGIGFGKNDDHNAQVLASVGALHGLGCPVLLGASRKSFVGRLSRGEAPKQRLPGSLSAHLAGLESGVQIVRVHDVPETAQALAIWRAMVAGS